MMITKTKRLLHIETVQKPKTDLRWRAAHDAFTTMMQAATNGNEKFTVEAVLITGYKNAFGNKPFPVESVDIFKLIEDIQWALMIKGCKEFAHEIPDNVPDFLKYNQFRNKLPVRFRFHKPIEERNQKKMIIESNPTVEEDLLNRMLNI